MAGQLPLPIPTLRASGIPTAEQNKKSNKNIDKHGTDCSQNAHVGYQLTSSIYNTMPLPLTPTKPTPTAPPIHSAAPCGS